MTKRKKARKRDYAAEYKRRIARATVKGYSKDAARGHVKRGRAGIKAARFLGIRPGEPLRNINVDDLENWQRVKQLVARDARDVFGKKPKRRSTGEEDYAAEYQLRLEELMEERGNREGRYTWDDETAFVREMVALGVTKRQAYTFWFSP